MPSHVGRKLATEGAAAEGAATPVNAASLRYFTKKLSPEAAQAHKPSQRTAHRQQIIDLSLEAWQECVREHSDGTKNLKFLFTTPHGSFVATLPPMLRELSRLHEQGCLRDVRCGSGKLQESRRRKDLCERRVTQDPKLGVLCEVSLIRFVWQRDPEVPCESIVS